MKRFICAAAVLAVALAGTARSEEKTTEQLVKELFAANKEVIGLLDKIKDKAAAEKAKPKLEELTKQMKATITELEKRPKPDVAGAFDALKEKPNSPNAIVEACDKLADRSAPAYEVLGGIPLIKEAVEANEARAKLNAQAIERVCSAYLLKNARWPADLADTAEYFEKGAESLKDPWGKEYKYTVAKDEKGVERAYVWCERKIGDKTKVLGTKPPESKK
jgi:hypothetical protein